MAKDSFYFKHDLHAREDEKWASMLRERGYRSYGLGWAIIERIYEEGGEIADNESAIIYNLRLNPALDPVEELRAVLASDLFYRREGFIRSHSADRRISEREAARDAGREFAARRWGKNGDPMGSHASPNARRKREEEKEITTAGASPSAVDRSIQEASDKASERLLDAKLEDARLPFDFGPFKKGVRIQDLSDTVCREIAAMPRLGGEFAAVLKRRIAQKASERFQDEREARGWPR